MAARRFSQPRYARVGHPAWRRTLDPNVTPSLGGDVYCELYDAPPRMERQGGDTLEFSAVTLTMVVAAAGSSACVVSLGGFDCGVTASRSATIDVGDATRVRVHARAGSLRIEGHPDLGKVRASGTACAGSDANLERVTLTATCVWAELVIETDTGDGMGQGRLDLVVEVPDSLPLEVDDGSSGIEIYDVAAVELRDGSVGIDIDGVAGDVRVVDGSGSIDISAVRGSVVIEDDGWGSIDITDVGQERRGADDFPSLVRAVSVGVSEDCAPSPRSSDRPGS